MTKNVQNIKKNSLLTDLSLCHSAMLLTLEIDDMEFVLVRNKDVPGETWLVSAHSCSSDICIRVSCEHGHVLFINSLNQIIISFLFHNGTPKMIKPALQATTISTKLPVWAFYWGFQAGTFLHQCFIELGPQHLQKNQQWCVASQTQSFKASNTCLHWSCVLTNLISALPLRVPHTLASSFEMLPL